MQYQEPNTIEEFIHGYNTVGRLLIQPNRTHIYPQSNINRAHYQYNTKAKYSTLWHGFHYFMNLTEHGEDLGIHLEDLQSNELFCQMIRLLGPVDSNYMEFIFTIDRNNNQIIRIIRYQYSTHNSISYLDGEKLEQHFQKEIHL